MGEKKKLILFDIDYTLFNAEHFRKSFFEVLVQILSPTDKDKFFELLEEIYADSKQETSFFDPKHFLKLLSEKVKITDNHRDLEAAIMQKEILESSMYEETRSVLEKLSRQENVILGILSWGNIPTQKAKIKLLIDYLDLEHIYIVEVDKRKILPDILKKYKNYKVFLIDDYQEVLFIAKKHHPDIYTVWIKRPETEGVKSRIFANFTPDSIISDLDELISLVASA